MLRSGSVFLRYRKQNSVLLSQGAKYVVRSFFFLFNEPQNKLSLFDHTTLLHIHVLSPACLVANLIQDIMQPFRNCLLLDTILKGLRRQLDAVAILLFQWRISAGFPNLTQPNGYLQSQEPKMQRSLNSLVLLTKKHINFCFF